MVTIYTHNSMYENYVLLAIKDNKPICSDAFISIVELRKELARLVDEYNYKGERVCVVGDVEYIV